MMQTDSKIAINISSNNEDHYAVDMSATWLSRLSEQQIQVQMTKDSTKATDK